MSTIEEARGQAREALAARLTGDILDAVPDDNDMQHVLELAASELRGPRPITDEMVQAGARALNDAGWTYEGADEPWNYEK